MAISHNRKLFHFKTPSSPSYHFSDHSSCPNFDDCYFFPDDPPRLPAPHSPLSAPVGKVYQISPIAIVIVVVLVTVFLLVSCSAFFLKCCTSWRRCFTQRNDPYPPNSDPSGPSQRESDNLFAENDDQEVNHPIWLISTVGLQQSVINTIAIVNYKKKDGLIEGTDCSVCLGEFEEEETLRVLPKCNHAFHIECIDPWLRSHTNCPLCRASIVPNPAPIQNPPPVTRMNDDSDSGAGDVELGEIETGGSSENRGSVDQNVDNHNVTDEINDGPLISDRRSLSVQLFPDSGTNLFRLPGSSSSSRVRHSPSFRFSPMVGPIKRSYSWSVRVIGSTDSMRCNSRFSP